MKLVVLLGAIVFISLESTGAFAGPDATYCREAIVETLKPDTPCSMVDEVAACLSCSPATTVKTRRGRLGTGSFVSSLSSRAEVD